jgi:hypothetical protein
MSIFMILIGLGLLKCLSGSSPMENKLTINVDVRFCAQSGAAVSGTVIRDHMGTIVATASTVLEGVRM